METALKNHIITKLEQLPQDRILEVLDFIEFILSKTTREKAKMVDASDKEILRAIEASGSLDFYYDDAQNVYTLEDGESPIHDETH